VGVDSNLTENYTVTVGMTTSFEVLVSPLVGPVDHYEVFLQP
jgi:hypothetical protein